MKVPFPKPPGTAYNNCNLRATLALTRTGHDSKVGKVDICVKHDDTHENALTYIPYSNARYAKVRILSWILQIGHGFVHVLPAKLILFNPFAEFISFIHVFNRSTAFQSPQGCVICAADA